jgi:hypothetical protein
MTGRPRSFSSVTPLNAYDYRAVHGSLGHHPSGELRQRMEVEDVREIVGREHPPRAASGAPRGHGGGTRAMHPGRARHCVPATRHPASARLPTDQPRIRDSLVGTATRARRDQRRAVAGAASDAVDACGLKGLGEGHRRQDGGESAGQHRRARPWWTDEKDVVVTTPASISVLPCARERQPPGDPKLGRAWVIVCKYCLWIPFAWLRAAALE